MSFDQPNYTQVPNILLDELMAQMGEAELRVVLAAVRRTFGYHTSDHKAEISFSLFEKLTGLSRKSVQRGIEEAKARGVLIEVERGRRGVVTYQLVVKVHQCTKSTSVLGIPEPVDVVHPLKKEIKKDSDAAKDSRAREDERPTVYAVYEQNIGLIGPHVRECLISAQNDYPAGWLEEAIKEAAEYNGRSWSYVESILKSWQAQGFKAKHKPVSNGQDQPTLAPATPSAPQINPFRSSPS